MTRCHDFFGDYAFRKAVPNMRRPPVNKALFEVWANVFARMSATEYQLLSSRKTKFFKYYQLLLSQQEFERAISRDSSAVSGVYYRYSYINALVDRVLRGR